MKEKEEKLKQLEKALDDLKLKIKEVEEIKEERPKEKEKLERVEKFDKPLPPKPLPKHLIEEHLNLNFMQDSDVLNKAFDDEETVDAVIKVMSKSPVEIQIVFKLVLDLYKTVNELKEEH